MAFDSGRQTEQAFRVAVIEGRKAYVTPSLFAEMQLTALRTMDDPVAAARAQANLLMLTDVEFSFAKRTGLEIIVDYDLND